MRCLCDSRLLLWPPFIKINCLSHQGMKSIIVFLCFPESYAESVSELGLELSLVLTGASSSTIFIWGLMILSAYALPSNLHCAFCNI